MIAETKNILWKKVFMGNLIRMIQKYAYMSIDMTVKYHLDLVYITNFKVFLKIQDNVGVYEHKISRPTAWSARFRCRQSVVWFWIFHLRFVSYGYFCVLVRMQTLISTSPKTKLLWSIRTDQPQDHRSIMWSRYRCFSDFVGDRWPEWSSLTTDLIYIFHFVSIFFKTRFVYILQICIPTSKSANASFK